MTTQELKLKTPLQLGEMDKDRLIAYIDKLHNTIKSYQIVIDVAVSKNEKVN